MSEYQRYEFMTVDRPLTPQQLSEVEDLSSHIEASSTRAFIEYHWGDFKPSPLPYSVASFRLLFITKNNYKNNLKE